jgi:hypothetical protein
VLGGHHRVSRAAGLGLGDELDRHAQVPGADGLLYLVASLTDDHEDRLGPNGLYRLEDVPQDRSATEWLQHLGHA